MPTKAERSRITDPIIQAAYRWENFQQVLIFYIGWSSECEHVSTAEEWIRCAKMLDWIRTQYLHHRFSRWLWNSFLRKKNSRSLGKSAVNKAHNVFLLVPVIYSSHGCSVCTSINRNRRGRKWRLCGRNVRPCACSVTWRITAVTVYSTVASPLKVLA